jgi:hypothetical protein
MTNYFADLALKMVIFADEEKVREAYFLTPFGFTRRVAGSWVLVSDQEEIDKTIDSLHRYEVDWRVTSEHEPASEVPFEHEIVFGLDSGQVSLADYKRYLFEKSEVWNVPVFPDSFRFSNELLPFAKALEEGDHLSVRQRFLLLCERTPANQVSRQGLGKFIADNLMSSPKVKNLDSLHLPKVKQMAKALESTVSACCTPQWYVVLRDLGQDALPII